MRRSFALVLTVIGMVMPFSAQEAQPDAGHRRAYEQLLDLYVRDGLVYYRALRAERGRLDGYVGALGGVSIESASREERLAFWLNAYNALVLKTVVDHYPIPLRSRDYPAHSIRQIPGAFERLQHRVAGQMLTLDQIEQMVLPMFADPRVYLALGRGAIGSGRLRSEPFAAATIETQLAEAAAECATRGQCVEIDRSNNQVGVSSIFSWRSANFIDAYAARAPGTFSARSPIERAVLALVEPKLLTTEKEFLAQNQFTVVYKPFDWSLNDLTGRGGR